MKKLQIRKMMKIDSLVEDFYSKRIVDSFQHEMIPLNVYILKNYPRNNLEFRIFDLFEKEYNQQLLRDGLLNLVDDISQADIVLFSVCEHLTTASIQSLSESNAVVKIGIVTSAVISVDLSSVYNLVILTQSIDRQSSDQQILSLFNAYHASLKSVSFANAIDVKRDTDSLNIYTVQYHETLLELGLFLLMSRSLPSSHSHLKIECESETQAQYVFKVLSKFDINITLSEKSVLINSSLTTSYNEALRNHEMISLLKVLRRSYNLYERTISC